MPERRLLQLAKLIEEMDDLTRVAEDEREKLRGELAAMHESLTGVLELMDRRGELASRARRLIVELLKEERGHLQPARKRANA